MNQPDQLEDETLQDFKSRARKAFNVYLKGLSLRKQIRPDRRKRVMPKRKEPKLDHYEWLVLYQCCGWRLAQIREHYPHVGTLPAIWMGIRDKAGILRLALRPRTAFKATVATRLEITPPYNEHFLNDFSAE
jgi:hypothetical protein